ncbi:DUF4349 domain-containing protein [Erythrobacter sp. YT30]|uniref:DUF4349 domain-containing protein n=1 Tax=Erythrobacter sp. YT30 TaxID=1735012 RepID=UPI00076BE655|nr:DUF4349 domain-containing protein [Erythrobacter sp. YT30]KWV90480.1 hypothetical protein AUC45_14670 [Erythrobacter sp. YT30]
MRKAWIVAGCAAMALAACSEAEMAEGVAADASLDMAVAPSEDMVADAGAAASPEPLDADNPSVGAPQIAYRYSLGFRLPKEAIKPLQERHADMCEAKGPRVCRIISMDQSESDGDYAYGNLRLAVAAREARDFSKALEASSGESDGELTSSSIQGEDLSKQIVDTEAKLRARTLLRDRLMEILRTRQGTVAELVEAERGVAQVNQEIDQAQSWLTEMRGRVAFSQMEISYNSGNRSSGSFTDPIRDAWNSLGGILGYTIAFLMMAATALIPIGLLIWIAVRLAKWTRRDSDESEALAREVIADAAAEETT